MSRRDDKVPDFPPADGFDTEFVGGLAEAMQGSRMMFACMQTYEEAGFTREESFQLLRDLMRMAQR